MREKLGIAFAFAVVFGPALFIEESRRAAVAMLLAGIVLYVANELRDLRELRQQRRDSDS